MEIAATFAERGTCIRRQVGAIAVDVHDRVLGMGRNGNASGLKHCNEGHECRGAQASPGANLDACDAIHAEINMLLRCSDVRSIARVYVTCAPCVSCIKALMASSCQTLIIGGPYPGHEHALELWKAYGRQVYTQVLER